MCTIYIEDPPQQFRCIVGSLTPTIDANFRNNCHGLSEISSFYDCGGPRGAFFRLFFAGILKPSLDCSKAIYFATSHKQLISSIQRTELFSLLSANAFDMDLRLHSALGFNIVTILRIWLFTKSIRLSRSDALSWELFLYRNVVHIADMMWKQYETVTAAYTCARTFPCGNKSHDSALLLSRMPTTTSDGDTISH